MTLSVTMTSPLGRVRSSPGADTRPRSATSLSADVVPASSPRTLLISPPLRPDGRGLSGASLVATGHPPEGSRGCGRRGAGCGGCGRRVGTRTIQRRPRRASWAPTTALIRSAVANPRTERVEESTTTAYDRLRSLMTRMRSVSTSVGESATTQAPGWATVTAESAVRARASGGTACVAAGSTTPTGQPRSSDVASQTWPSGPDVPGWGAARPRRAPRRPGPGSSWRRRRRAARAPRLRAAPSPRGCVRRGSHRWRPARGRPR